MPLHHSNHAPIPETPAVRIPAWRASQKEEQGVNSHAPIVPRWALISSASHKVEQKEAQGKKQKL